MRPASRPRWMPPLGLLALSLALSLSALVPLAYLGMPHLVRWRHLHQLASDDRAQRERALNAIVRNAGDDPRLLQGVLATLPHTDQAHFLEIVMALDMAGCWRRAQVGQVAWLRWLEVLSAGRHPESRILAAQRLANLRDLACDAAVLAMLGRLLDDRAPDVRYNALVSAGALAGASNCVPAYRALMLPRLVDPSALVRRHAWLILGALGQGKPRPSTATPPTPLAAPSSPAMEMLASLEAAPVGSTDVMIEKNMPPLLRLLAVWKNRGAAIQALWPLFCSEQSTLRDLACVVAWERGERSDVAALARRLLSDFDRRAQLSGAVLSGMTHSNADLLQKRLAIDASWASSQMMRLGLWMQGQDDAFASTLPGLLLREDEQIPASSLILGMLHAGDAAVRQQAFDALLNPSGEPAWDLIELLQAQRWWHVLKRYLPPSSPRLNLWANPSMMRFELDQLRDTYLVQRTHWLTHRNAGP